MPTPAAARGSHTLIGRSIAGTADFAAPEQMGRRDDPIGPYSDVYGWAKACCYALFQTTQPLRSHWGQLPRRLADLLECCLTEDPTRRPQAFATVLEKLDQVSSRSASGWRYGSESRSPGPGEGPTRVAEADDQRLKGRKKRKTGNKRWSPLVFGIAAALLLTLTAVLVGWRMFRVEARAQIAEASSAATPSVTKPRSQASDLSITREVEFPVSPSVRMVFCWIPPGESRLGSPPGEAKQANRPDRGAEDEHVFATPGFWLGKYEVTQAEWVAVMGNNPSAHDGRKPNSATKMDTSRISRSKTSVGRMPGGTSRR